MDYLNTIFKDVKIPKLTKIQQTFDKYHIEDIDKAVKDTIAASDLAKRIKPGDTVAIGGGSRGVTDIHKITRAIVNEVKALGAKPFIVPACGSHGNAIAEGQIEVLAGYGITEEFCGCPVRASMEVIQVGSLSDGTPVYFDKIASEASAVIPVNRIKAHTDITGDFGSGVAKMLVIGFGKHKGASTIHRRGLTCLKQSLREGSELILSKMNVVLGIGIVENAYHQPTIIKAMNPETLLQEESQLLIKSKELMAMLPADNIDLLVVQDIGKDISGSGMDTNVIGRLGIWREPEFEKPVCTKIVALRMTPLSHGNAVGVGLADFCPKTLVDQIDFDALYTNMLTATYVQRGMLPIIMANEEEAIKAGLDTCWSVPHEKARIMFIKNTADIGTVYASEALLPDILSRGYTRILGEPIEIQFTKNGQLKDLEYE